MSKKSRTPRDQVQMHPGDFDKAHTSLPYLTDEQRLAYKLYVRERVDTFSEIAERVGVSPSTISRWVKKYNWKAQRQIALVSPDMIADMIADMLRTEVVRMDTQVGGLRTDDVDKLSKLVSSLRKIAPNKNFFGSIYKAMEEWMEFLHRENPALAQECQKYLMAFTKEMAEKYDT